MTINLLNKSLYSIILLFVIVGTMSSVCATSASDISNGKVIISKNTMNDQYDYDVYFYSATDELIVHCSGKKEADDANLVIPPTTTYFTISLASWKKAYDTFKDRKFKIEGISADGITGITFALSGKLPFNKVEYKYYGSFYSEALYGNA
jgi:hypothetical protein